ncbi:lysophospholipase [Dentipellis sp. KUC8613]|nr:lysophospholipase [Dentipellis sp. KUC8613]
MASSEPYTEEWLTGPASTAFYTRTYLPPPSSSSSPTTPSDSPNPKAALVFIHGFIEHVGRYTHVHAAWAARGFAVFAFDGRGFGRTALDAAHRTRGSRYGRTSAKEQMLDVAWAVRSVRERWAGVPVFLMGHSMGGGIVLQFAAGGGDKEVVGALAGVIASSPLLRLTHPPLGLVRWAGGKLGILLPDQYIPATVKPETLSHDPQIVEDNKNDKLCGKGASLRCVDDMLSKGEMLVESGYNSWPVDLPILLFHGTADEVNLFDATKEFYEKVPAKDKTFNPYEGGFHELHNEPDGVKEKVIGDCIAWAEARLSAAPGSGSAARL